MKIMIVEDDILLKEELKMLLENHGYSVDTIDEFSDIKDKIVNSKSNLVLMDINIPKTSGDYVLRELRKVSDIPVIMVTSKNTETDELISMSYGADDYVTKPYNPLVLLLRIEAVLKRTNRLSSILNYNDLVLDIQRSKIERKGKEVSLSKNELQILTYFIENKGVIVSREDIMRYLWDSEEFIDDNTLTVNITRIRKKLESIGIYNVIETKRGLGYILI